MSNVTRSESPCLIFQFSPAYVFINFAPTSCSWCANSFTFINLFAAGCRALSSFLCPPLTFNERNICARFDAVNSFIALHSSRRWRGNGNRLPAPHYYLSIFRSVDWTNDEQRRAQTSKRCSEWKHQMRLSDLRAKKLIRAILASHHVVAVVSEHEIEMHGSAKWDHKSKFRVR